MSITSTTAGGAGTLVLEPCATLYFPDPRSAIQNLLTVRYTHSLRDPASSSTIAAVGGGATAAGSVSGGAGQVSEVPRFILFKIKTTTPTRYGVHPRFGLLELLPSAASAGGGSSGGVQAVTASCDVKITYRGEKDEAILLAGIKDKFQLEYRLVNSSSQLAVQLASMSSDDHKALGKAFDSAPSVSEQSVMIRCDFTTPVPPAHVRWHKVDDFNDQASRLSVAAPSLAPSLTASRAPSEAYSTAGGTGPASGSLSIAREVSLPAAKPAAASAASVGGTTSSDPVTTKATDVDRVTPLPVATPPAVSPAEAEVLDAKRQLQEVQDQLRQVQLESEKIKGSIQATRKEHDALLAKTSAGGAAAAAPLRGKTPTDASVTNTTGGITVPIWFLALLTLISFVLTYFSS